MSEEGNADHLVSRTIALATLAWYYEEQIKFNQNRTPGNASAVADYFQRKVHVINELEKIVDIPYINEHPSGGDWIKRGGGQ